MIRRTPLRATAMSAAVLLCPCSIFAKPGGSPAVSPALQLSFGPAGLEKLSYNGVPLEDTKAVPSDAFHIWHMKATDLHGKPLTAGQYGWGENAATRQWDPRSHTWIYTYVWGSISTQYVQHGNILDVVVTIRNGPGSGAIFDGATVYPLTLHFPTLPEGFTNASYPQLAFNTVGPGVTIADYGRGEVVAVSPDPGRPLYTGFVPSNTANTYAALVSGTPPDNLASFQPHNDRPVAPGQTDTYRLSLRFAKSRTSAASLAADAYSNWAHANPPVLHWSDRRPIGTVFLASSPAGDPHVPGGFANNPRRYFTDPNADDFDIYNPAGLAAFQRRVLDQARINVANLTALGAQGSITWDIEGEQFPQDTSYLCAPDQIAQLAPEMESIISDKASPYAGMRLDDAYFKIMRSAGFRVGVCVRPQHLRFESNGDASQDFLPNASVAQELARKIRFAHDRWGATLFYVDSTVDGNRSVLPAAIFKQLAEAFPDSLLIPEESTPLYYAYTAPFKSFLYRDATGTDPEVYHYYPQAFSAVLINNVSPFKLAGAEAQLAGHVGRGDVLMGQVNYREANNAKIAALYQRAGKGRPHRIALPKGSMPSLDDRGGSE